MIKSIMIPIPNNRLIKQFESDSTPLFKKIYFNQCQIHKLINLRDILLPKLMSGDAKVVYESSSISS